MFPELFTNIYQEIMIIIIISIIIRASKNKKMIVSGKKFKPEQDSNPEAA